MFIPKSPFSNCTKCGQTTISMASNCAELNIAYAGHHRDLLLSNHRTEETEITALEEIPLLESFVDDLETRLKAAVFLVDRLRNELDHTQQSIALRKAIIAPIRKLPNEVLERIFFEAHPSNWSPFDMNGPWVIAQVCSRWREVSCSSPRLWSSFLCLAGWNEDTLEAYWGESGVRCLESLDVIQECLQRSGTFPLTFKLQLRGGCINEILAVTTAIFSHCERWKDLEVGHSLDHVPAALSTSLKGRLSLLERLEVWGRDTQDLAVAPCLRELDTPSTKTPFPWSQIQILRLNTRHDWNQTVAILSKSRNVIQCELRQSTPERAPASLRPVGPFNNLRILRCPISALNAFGTMPVLEELHVTDIYDFDLARIDSSEAAQLRVLSIELATTRCEQLISFLRSCTGLETLHLGYSRVVPQRFSFPTTVIDALRIETTDSVHRTILPSLKHLKLGLGINNDDEVNHWLSIAHSRCPPLGTLESLQISPYYKYPFTDPLDVIPDKFKYAQDQGLQIQLGG
ncbi:hypothetical protein C8J56DRAFT_829551 [Mycena floridula]|nr:hypothetical protein C8J56DRAFT_834589 [Mycena floridula]KAJ7585323.1 hypothetical protein C8J56DRAFT_829551 [Mycena floridula]